MHWLKQRKKKFWIVTGITLLVLYVIGITAPETSQPSNANKPADTKIAAEQPKQQEPKVPDISAYLSKQMTDVAQEFGQTYDPANSRQIRVSKDGYNYYFENAANTNAGYSGKANVVSLTLPQMGECKQAEVFNRIDEAMRQTGLDPATKGDRYDGAGGTQFGYGAYRNYKGDRSLEIALLCDLADGPYKLQLKVLPQYR
jgi:hypothetical protein